MILNMWIGKIRWSNNGNGTSDYVNVTSWIWNGEGDILIVWYSVFHNYSKYSEV